MYAPHFSDNKALYDICFRTLNLTNPTCGDLNHLGKCLRPQAGSQYVIGVFVSVLVLAMMSGVEREAPP